MYKNALLLFALCIGLNSFAQKPLDNNGGLESMPADDNSPKVRFGLKLTPSVAWMNVEHDNMQAEGATLKMGFGGVADFQLGSVVSFVAGLGFQGLGGYVHDNASLADTIHFHTYKLNYNEIQIPLQLRLRTPFVKKTAYFVEGGFSLGFIVSANEKYSPVAKDADPAYVKTDLITSPTHLSYCFGAGIEHRIYKTSSLFGLIAFNKSVSNVASKTGYTTGTNPRYTTPLVLLPASMEFSVGVMF
ncbi:MAG TPA: outer membrane beta-barrel protein [Paludibacter sp.]|nr:outer membrane beta-barrel protein [Paludibacter sp.]